MQGWGRRIDTEEGRDHRKRVLKGRRRGIEVSKQENPKMEVWKNSRAFFSIFPYFCLQEIHNICAAHIGMDGIRIEKEPRQRDEYVYRIS